MFIGCSSSKYVLGWVINNFCFLKVICNYAFQTSSVLNATGNDLIKESLPYSFLFY